MVFPGLFRHSLFLVVMSDTEGEGYELVDLTQNWNWKVGYLWSGCGMNAHS
jgi:hypothetical protein